MRIFGTEPLARKFSGMMGDFIGKKDGSPKIFSKKHVRTDHHFLTWPSLSVRHISALAGFNQQPKVQLTVLQVFLHKRQKIEEQYCGLMASALLRDTIDDTSEASLSKARAVQRMVHLIKVSVTDIETIGLLNISRSKG